MRFDPFKFFFLLCGVSTILKIYFETLKLEDMVAIMQ